MATGSGVPAHKCVPGTSFTVDGFRCQQPWVTAYWLTHAHSDHYSGITENWAAGPIYCSPITAALVQQITGVHRQFLHPLELNKPHKVQGAEVTLVDANHCPGAVLLLFRLPDGRRLIHTGDMRYCQAMKGNQHLEAFRGADAVYLDTTYCSPKYTFPAQDAAVEFVASCIHQLLQEDDAAASVKPAADIAAEQDAPGLLERLLLATAQRTGRRLLVSPRKLRLLRCQGLTQEQLEASFTLDPAESPIQVVSWGHLGDAWPYFRPNFTNMEEARQQAGAQEVVGFVPTGWLWEMKKMKAAAADGSYSFPFRTKGACTVHLVPYSEHSSFSELREFIGWLRPKQVVPTVGASDSGSAGDKARVSMLQHFRVLEALSSKGMEGQLGDPGPDGLGAAGAEGFWDLPGDLDQPLELSAAEAAKLLTAAAGDVNAAVNLFLDAVSKDIRDAPLLPLTRYNPLKHACWSPGVPAPYLALALTLAAVDGTTKRLVISDGLTNLFRSLMLLSPQDVTAAAYLACGVSRQRMREMYTSYGDLGDVAQACKRRQPTLVPPPPLTISGVLVALRSIAAQSGPGAAGRRQAAVAGLLRCCRDVEPKYLVRTLIQNLRVGAGWRSVLGPLAKAALLHRKMLAHAATAATMQPSVNEQQQQQHPAAGLALTAEQVVAAATCAAGSTANVSKQQLEAAAAAAAAAYHTCPDLSILVRVLMEDGPEGLAARVQLTPGVPGGAEAALAQGFAILAEYKYDGQRAQIHITATKQVHIFSRNSEDRTAAFPDVCSAILAAADPELLPMVIDAELVAVDRADGNRDLMRLPFRDRRAAAGRALPHVLPGVVQMAEGVEVLAVSDFFFSALAAGSEGLMLKLLDGPGSVYQPAKRGLSWLKLKKDYLEGLADSIDVVPIGAWQGQGRKVNWFSPFLLAVYDSDTETYQSLCRCMSGFTDEFYAAATARLGALALPGGPSGKPIYYDTREQCSVWFPPNEVWELRGADLSISPVHRAAAGRLHAEKGLGLRFPRFLRVRADKHPEEASGPDLVEQLEEAVIRIFETSAPAVVNIVDVSLPIGGKFIPEADVPEGNGTGIVWDQQGHVVTNYHVLQSSLAKFGASPSASLSPSVTNPAIGKRVALVTLQTADGTQHTYDATLVGADRARDLAVVQINAPGEFLKPLQLGSSEPGRLRVGQLCLAIGNPFGFDHTLTTGVISGLSRDIRSQLGSIIPGGIQTDAAINPGNSGGPLLNSAGQLIGLNTAIFTPTGTSAGVGFALPVATVARVVPQLIRGGRVLRPSLGVQISSDAVAQKLKVTTGALISAVVPDGAAAAAGLLATRRGLGGVLTGDVIIALNGRKVLNAGDLFNALEQYAIGDKVQLSILRTAEQGRTQQMDVAVVLLADTSAT
eukprot:gene4079-4326_t